jgi:hypothetical protein
MVFVARLPELNEVQHWRLPSAVRAGTDIDHRAGVLYVTCDGARS